MGEPAEAEASRTEVEAAHAAFEENGRKMMAWVETVAASVAEAKGVRGARAA